MEKPEKRFENLRRFLSRQQIFNTLHGACFLTVSPRVRFSDLVVAVCVRILKGVQLLSSAGRGLQVIALQGKQHRQSL